MNELLQVPPAEFQKFLLWGIAGLVSVVGIIWRLYVSALKQIEANSKSQMKRVEDLMEVRVNDKQEVIDGLYEEVKRLQIEKEKIISEIKPSLDAANSIASSVLNMMRNGK